jgi:adenine phosphoribosyltransferase
MAERDGGPADPGDATNARYLEGQRLYLAECDPPTRAGLVVDNSDLAAPRLVRGPATSVVRAGRAEVLRTFRWVGGHGDVWAVFRDAQALRAVVQALAEPYRGRVDAVLGIESRGFLLGGAVAVELGVGFVPVRRAGGAFPGPLTSVRTRRDYRGREVELAVQSGALSAGQRVVLVDDWVETGGHVRAVTKMARSLGAEVVGVAVVVEQLDESVRPALPPVHAVVTFPELPAYGR